MPNDNPMEGVPNVFELNKDEIFIYIEKETGDFAGTFDLNVRELQYNTDDNKTTIISISKYQEKKSVNIYNITTEEHRKFCQDFKEYQYKKAFTEKL